jgi:DNA-binding MarR family transcriptional regulator
VGFFLCCASSSPLRPPDTFHLHCPGKDLALFGDFIGRDETPLLLANDVTPVGSRSTITQDYTATHSALTEVAREVGLARTQVRVLLALAERHGRARSDELERDLGVDSSAVRRSLIALYERELCAGSPRKRGTRTTVTLTEDGHAIVDMVLSRRDSLPLPDAGSAGTGSLLAVDAAAAAGTPDPARSRATPVAAARQANSAPIRNARR